MRLNLPLKSTIMAVGLSLGMVLQGTVAMAQQAKPFTDAQRQAIEEIIHDYIMDNPEILPRAIEALQARAAQASIMENQDALFKDPDSVVVGNPKGDVTVVEFFDYTCGYCKVMVPTFQKLLSTDKNVRVILKEFPVRGPVAEKASKAALAARAQNKYLALHDALYAINGQLTEDLIFNTAQSVGIDVARLKKDMESPAIAAIIQKNRELGAALNLRGTPAMVVNESLVPGMVSYEELTEIIKEERAALKR